MALPDCAVETKALQLASGTGVSPCRAENAALVLDAVTVVHDSPPQSTACVASKTRDRNTPLGEYGLMRSHSTDTPPDPTATSLASGRSGTAIVMACVATTVPSTEYSTAAGVQSMRNRCADPTSEPAIGVSMLTAPEFVRANSAPPLNVLKIAHGAASSVSANPTCWNGLPLKVATKSSDRPAAKLAMVPAFAPSTTSRPFDTVAVPP